MANIKKIKLSDGSVYSIFDEGALRLDPESNKLLTGNKVVDNVIIEGNLSILEIDDVPLDASIDNVLVQDATTGQVKKRSTDKLLEDIGGISYSIDNTSGTLSFKLGKQ